MRKYWILLTLFFVGLVVSAIFPHDYFTWFLEVFPAILALIALVLTSTSSGLPHLLTLLLCYIAISYSLVDITPMLRFHYLIG